MPRPQLWLRLYEAALRGGSAASADPATIARIAALMADYGLIEYETRLKTRMRYEAPTEDRSNDR